jgi:hypothetical protein
MVGPAVPEDIAKLRQQRYANEYASDINGDGNEKKEETKKIKQFFDHGKSLNEELKKEILSNLKTVKDRFE